MRRPVGERLRDYLLLLIVGGLLFLPNLGAHSLWDVDESHNAECAREMLIADNWIVPTFNYALRTDKPALLYWLMIFAYQCLGVSEFSARIWSALCGLGSVLAVYELGRSMFDRLTGLLAGIVLGSAILFCVSAHAATPDALLIFFTLLTFLVFWKGRLAPKPGWLVWIGVTTGLAVLAKGPVGLALPSAAIGLFLLWERRLSALLDRQLVLGLLLFTVVAGPWYVLVGVETKWKFFWDQATGQGFFLKHNVGRFMQPLERHGGPIVYHPLALLAGFAPWSAFLGLSVWYATGRRWSPRFGGANPVETGTPTPAAAPYRFLWCWIGLWLAFFSLAGTKLPNYLLPAYPALALLTGRFLVRWQSGALPIGRGWINVSLTCLGLVGVVVGVALFLASGWIRQLPLKGRELPGLAPWALTGLLLPAAALLGWGLLKQDRRAKVLAVVVAGCVLFVAVLAAFGPVAVDQSKTPRKLAEDIARHQAEPDIQVACHDFYQPGLVFYSGRMVKRFDSQRQDSIDFLHSPLQRFLVITAGEWKDLSKEVEMPCRVVGRQRDFATGKEVLLVTNRPPASPG